MRCNSTISLRKLTVIRVKLLTKLRQLVSLVKDAALYTLDLSENSLGDHVATSLFGALGQNNSLKALHLRNTKLSDAVTAALKSDMNDVLRQIDLKHNGLTDTSLEHVKLFLDAHYHVIGLDLDGTSDN